MKDILYKIFLCFSLAFVLTGGVFTQALANTGAWSIGDDFMTIKKNGDGTSVHVGIGTTSPSEKLDVLGGVKLGNTTTENAGTVRFTGSDFEGRVGTEWKSLTKGSAGGSCSVVSSSDFASTAVLSCEAGTLSSMRVEWQDKLGKFSTPFGVISSLDSKTASMSCLMGNCKLYGLCCLSEAVSSGGTGGGTTLNISGENGQIQFNNSGVLGSDSGFFWNNIDKKLGIGTTNPGAPFHVYTNVNTYAAIFGDVNAANLRIAGSAEGSSGYGLLQQFGGTGNLVLQRDSGNVGIGTTTPVAKLHVYGNTSNSSIFLGENGSSDKTAILKYFQGNGVGTGRFWLGHWGDDDSLGVGMNILKGGNVGIGTATPTHRLMVLKDPMSIPTYTPSSNFISRFIGNTANTMSSLENYSDGNGSGWISFIKARGTPISPSALLKGDRLMTLEGRGYDGANFNIYGGFTIVGKTTEDWNATGNGGAIIFNTTQNGTIGPQNRMTIDHTGNVGIGTPEPTEKLEVAGGMKAGRVNTPYIISDAGNVKIEAKTGNINTGAEPYHVLLQTEVSNGMMGIGSTWYGNVGIGTSNPTEKLTVSGNIFLSGGWNYLNFGSLSGTGGYGIRDNGGVMEYKNSGGAWAALSSGGSGGTSQWTTGTGNISYSGGNVGIGTATPDQKLVVYNSSAPAIKLNDNVSNAYLGIATTASNYGNFSNAGSLIIRNSNGIQFSSNDGGGMGMTILSNGNVGIGTTSPTQKLDISGESATGMRIASTTDNNTFISLSSNGVQKAIMGYRASDKAFVLSHGEAGTNLASPTLALKDGNVGIGTANPTEKLHVKDGSIGVYNTAERDFKLLGVTSYSLPTQTGIYSNNTWSANYQSWLNFKVTDIANTVIEAMTIRPNGNVGIGTTNPGAKLDVNGNIANQASALNSLDASTVRIQNANVGALNQTAKLAFDIGGIGKSVVGGYYATYNGAGDIGTGLLFGTQTNLAGGTIERMRIDQNGNVGIGTTSPVSLLTLQTTNHQPLFLVRNLDVNAVGSESTSIRFGGLVGNTPTAGAEITGSLINANNGELRLNVLSSGGMTDRVIILANGNVGIGTTTPLSKLDLGESETTNQSIRMGSGGRYGMGFSTGSGLLNIFTHNLSNGIRIGFDNGSYGTVHSNAFVYLSNNSNFGIGTTTPSYKLQVAGTAAGTSWTNTSDMRLKNSIVTIPSSSLETLQKIRPVSFHWNDAKDPTMEKLQFGFIAQEVEPIFPNLVSTADDAMKTKSVNYDGFIPLLVSSVQELKTKNDTKDTEIAELKAQNAEKDAQIAEILKRLEALEK